MLPQQRQRQQQQGMEYSNAIRESSPQVNHLPRRTGSLLAWDRRRPSALLVDSSAGGLSTTIAAASEHGAGEGWLAEGVPGHPSGKGRHYANDRLLADRCQLTKVTVSRPLKRWVMAKR